MKMSYSDTTRCWRQPIQGAVLGLLVLQMSATIFVTDNTYAAEKMSIAVTGGVGSADRKPPEQRPGRRPPSRPVLPPRTRPNPQPPSRQPDRPSQPPRQPDGPSQPPSQPDRAQRAGDAREGRRDERRRQDEADRRNARNREELERNRHNRAEQDRAHRRDEVRRREDLRRREVEQDRRDRQHRIADRHDRRREVRDEFRRHRRPIPLVRPPMVRNPARWQYRYRRWYDHYYRPLPPRRPIDVIIIPIPYPDDRYDYWGNDNISEVADVVEQLSYQLYVVAQTELAVPTEWNRETLSLLYDVVDAARIYSDAVDVSRNVYRETLFELFNLEETVRAAGSNFLCGPVSDRLRDNFAQLKYYVAELLWQYRIDDSFDRDDFYGSSSGFSLERSRLNMESRTQSDVRFSALTQIESGYENDVMACTNMSFRWPKPHDQNVWDVSSQKRQIQADELVLFASSIDDRIGAKGLAGITSLIVVYTNGQQEDLVSKLANMGDSHLYRNGQLRLDSEIDEIVVPLLPWLAVDRIYMVADSWVAPDVDVLINVSLKRRSVGEPRLP